MSSKLLPCASFLVTLLSCVAMLLPQDDGTHQSFICSVAVMLFASILFLPVITGIAAMDATFFGKGRSQLLLESQPSSVRLRLACVRCTAIALFGGAGILVSVVVAWIIARTNGGSFQWSVWPYCAIAVAAVIAASFIGWALGVLIKSWLFPVLIAVALYLVSAFEVPYLYLQTEALTSIWTPHPTLVEFSPWYIAASIGLHGCIGALGVAVLLVWSDRSRLRIILLVLVIGLCGFLHGALWHGWFGSQEIHVSDTSNWQCSEMFDGTPICIPSERGEDLPQLIADLEPIHERLLELDLNLQDRTWRAIDEPPGTSVVYELPLGRSLPSHDHALAVASGLFEACTREAYEHADELSIHELALKQEMVMLWVDPEVPDQVTGPSGRAWNLTLEDVKEAYNASKGCL